MNARSTKALWLVVAVVIGVVVALVVFPLLDKATAKANAAPITLTSGQVIGRQISVAFKEGDLGNSKGRVVPRKVKRKLNRYANNNGLTDSQRWWKGTLERGMCVTNTSALGPYSADFCLRYGDHPKVAALNLEIWKVKVVCGGAGAIAMTKGGVAGFGTGAAACVWTRYANRWLD